MAGARRLGRAGWSCARTACGGILAADGRKCRLSTAAADGLCRLRARELQSARRARAACDARPSAPSLLPTLTSEAQMTTHPQSEQIESSVSRRGLVQALAVGAAASITTPASAQPV